MGVEDTGPSVRLHILEKEVAAIRDRLHQGGNVIQNNVAEIDMLKADVHRLDSAVFGNGSPGLKEQVALLVQMQKALLLIQVPIVVGMVLGTLKVAGILK